METKTIIENKNISNNNKLVYGILGFFNIFFIIKSIILTFFLGYIYNQLEQEIPILEDIPEYIFVILLFIFLPILLFYFFRFLTYLVGLFGLFTKKQNMAKGFAIANAIMFILEYLLTIVMTASSTLTSIFSGSFFYIATFGLVYVLIPIINITIMVYIIYFLTKNKNEI